ncbi:MAG TPA: hypothetical protein DGT53_05205, partial [Dialister sp.]|nr:hypothetical protein [Dialister sp.]
IYFAILRTRFLLRRFALLSRQTGNCSHRVSYGNDSQCSHAEQETGGEKFPMVMIAKVPTADGKLFAKGFLWQ